MDQVRGGLDGHGQSWPGIHLEMICPAGGCPHREHDGVRAEVVVKLQDTPCAANSVHADQIGAARFDRHDQFSGQAV